jgi:hypothetical protein
MALGGLIDRLVVNAPVRSERWTGGTFSPNIG